MCLSKHDECILACPPCNPLIIILVVLTRHGARCGGDPVSECGQSPAHSEDAGTHQALPVRPAGPGPLRVPPPLS